MGGACLGAELRLPATTAFLVLKVFVEDNWHATQACVTDDEDVIQLNIHALFDKATGLAMAKQVANWDKFKQQVDESEVPGQQAWRWPPPMPCEMGLSGKKKRKLGEAE